MKSPDDWTAGYLCCVATLLRQHGEDGLASNLLACIEIPPSEQIIDADRDILDEFGFLETAEQGNPND